MTGGLTVHLLYALYIWSMNMAMEGVAVQTLHLQSDRAIVCDLANPHRGIPQCLVSAYSPQCILEGHACSTNACL